MQFSSAQGISPMKKHVWFSLAGTALLLLGTVKSVRAATFSDIDPNDTFETAQFLDTPDQTITVEGSVAKEADLGPDFFKFSAIEGEFLNLMAQVTEGSEPGWDTLYLELYESSGNLLAEAKGEPDWSQGFVDKYPITSISNYPIQTSGLYAASVSCVVCGYRLQVDRTAQPVPEPSSVLGTLALGLLGGGSILRHKQKHSKIS